MVRKYKKIPGSKNYQNYTKETLVEAVEAYKRGDGTLKAISERYGIPVATIFRKTKGMHPKKAGGQTILSEVEELSLANALSVAAEWGFPLEPTDVKDLVKNYLDRNGIRVDKFNNNRPGEGWLAGFLNRNKTLSKRFSQSIKESRAKVNFEVINKYFDHLEESLRDIPLEALVNYDETNFSDDPGAVKVIVRRKCKRAEKIMDSSKSATSVMFACTASGIFLPLYIIYKAENLWSTWTESGPDRARYNRSKSGWFDATLFNDWFRSIVLPYFKSLGPGPKALIGDNLASHLTIDVISECQLHNIRFIVLPPNSTHMTQPLDVSCFRPIKGAWRKILRDWKQHNKGVIRKDHFPRLLKKALKEIESNREGIIKSAFEATGMVPLNREKVLSKLPKENVSASEAEERMANSLKDIFQTQRFGKAGSAAVERKRKLKVEAGKSICVEDLVALRPQTSTMTENPRKRSNLRRDNKKTHKNIQKKDKYSHDSSSDTAEEEIVYEDSTDTETFSDLEERDLEPEDTRTEQHVVDGHLITETEEKESETEQDKNSEEVEQTENKNDTKKEIVNVNDYIITALTTTKGVTKKYVAKILERDKESFLCSFLRPSRKISGAFIFPDVEDISLVNQNEIKKKLDAPQNLRRGQLMFNNVKLI